MPVRPTAFLHQRPLPTSPHAPSAIYWPARDVASARRWRLRQGTLMRTGRASSFARSSAASSPTEPCRSPYPCSRTCTNWRTSVHPMVESGICAVRRRGGAFVKLWRAPTCRGHKPCPKAYVMDFALGPPSIMCRPTSSADGLVTHHPLPQPSILTPWGKRSGSLRSACGEQVGKKVG